jgi:diaminohydroxyphosphoribosylaminopyrimidine deaminase/5-amino-6-(5-phosphoribosylamino)uracil reductase
LEALEEKKRHIDMGYMKRALELAENGIGKTSPNPLVGAVIVKNGRIIGEGWHEKYGGDHAEVNAIKNAIEPVESAEIYVNLEPCCHYGKTPPCSKMIIEKGIKRVIIGAADPNPKVDGGGIKALIDAGIEVTIGVMEEKCRKLNEVFYYYHEKRRPFVVAKTAISLDGKTTAPSGESKWITGEVARNEVQHLRNRYSAIMVGIGTVIKDDPELTCRIEGDKNPVRIILDSNLRISSDSGIKLSSAITSDGMQCITCKAFRMNPGQNWFVRIYIAHYKRNMMFSIKFVLVASYLKFSIFCRHPCFHYTFHKGLTLTAICN